MAVMPDCQTIVSSSNDRTLKFWDLATGKCISTSKAMLGAVRVWQPCQMARLSFQLQTIGYAKGLGLGMQVSANPLLKVIQGALTGVAITPNCRNYYLSFRRQDAEDMGFSYR